MRWCTGRQVRCGFFGQVLNPATSNAHRWYEMPAKIRNMGIEAKQELYASDPTFAGIPLNTPITRLPDTVHLKLFQAFKKFRLRTREFSDHEVVREIREIIQN